MYYPKISLTVFALLPALGVKPACAQQPLTLAQVAPDIAITEAVARRPLSVQERAQVVAIDQDLFRRDPAWTLKALHQEVPELQQVRRLDAVQLADWRKTHLTSTYFYTGPYLTPEEAKMLVAVYTCANPIVSADRASGTVVTESDMAAWQAAARLAAAQTHTPMTWTRTAMLKVLQDPKLPKNVREDAGNMERNWMIYKLGWAHEPAAYRRYALTYLAKTIHQFTASGLPAVGLGGAALHLGALAYGDYPYLMDPRFAVTKYKILAQMLGGRGQATNNMIMDQAIRENGRLMRNGVQERGGLAPHAGDEGPAPFHYPTVP